MIAVRSCGLATSVADDEAGGGGIFDGRQGDRWREKKFGKGGLADPKGREDELKMPDRRNAVPIKSGAGAARRGGG